MRPFSLPVNILNKINPVTKTTMINNSKFTDETVNTIAEMFPSMKSATIDHIAEIATESGVDLDEEFATSNHNHINISTYPNPIETWYQESACWEPYRAWIKGVGIASGNSAVEAAENAAKKAADKLMRDAAPELLAACKWALDSMYAIDKITKDLDVKKKMASPVYHLKTAIAKATTH